MRFGLPDLFGLTIGFGLGGIALALLLPRLPIDRPSAPTLPDPPLPAVSAPSAFPAPQGTRRVTRAEAPAPPQSAPPQSGPPQAAPPWSAPRTPAPSPHAMLPNIIRPDGQGKPGGRSGTGFFIGSDGTLLSAAHVVDDCRRAQIASRYVRLTDAVILARDPSNDLALLRAPAVRPPAILPLATDRPADRDLMVFGYPGGGDTLAPSEAPATLRSARQSIVGGRPDDPLDLVHIDAASVRHGFSGGPIVDGSGEVIGVLKAMFIRQEGNGPVIDTGMAFGPGPRTIAAFLHRAAPGIDPAAVSRPSGAPIDAARRAVVHVFCWGD